MIQSELYLKLEPPSDVSEQGIFRGWFYKIGKNKLPTSVNSSEAHKNG